MTQKCRFALQMEPNSFLTISGPAEGQYKELGSKFLAFAFPVESDEEIKEKLEQLRKKYFDATHHCYAWILGADKSRYRSNDDGEPSHSAGDPILGQIRSKNLTNVLIVVVRYYGGTKLGVGGLIHAYKTAAEEALNNSTIVEMQVMLPLAIRFDYESMPDMMRLVKEFEIQIISQDFAEHVVMQLRIKKKNHVAVINRIELLISMGQKILI